jgi:predicted transcriptional regulator
MAEREGGTKQHLSRREQEVLDLVYAVGRATAREVRTAMRRPPTDAAVRATLRALVTKGHLQITQDGPRYQYEPTKPRAAVQRSELLHLVRTFFGGSTRNVLVTLLDLRPDDLDRESRRRLKAVIDQAEREGR